MDNQRGLISTEKERETLYKTWARQEGIILETVPTYTHKPNGTAERYGQIIQSKLRKMKTTANLPEELWTEIWTALAYLHNRTPSERNEWKSPIEVLNQYMNDHNILFKGNYLDLRPD